MTNVVLERVADVIFRAKRDDADIYAAARSALSEARDPIGAAIARLRYAGDLFHDQGSQLEAEACWKAMQDLEALSPPQSEPQ